MSASSPAEVLVARCIEGDEDAWTALIGKYERLIYSIPIKYGLSRDDASDVFQQVCVQLLGKLETLREPRSLPAWLIRTTSRECFHLAAKAAREDNAGESLPEIAASADEIPERLARELEQEQLLRETLRELAPRCRELLGRLFFETPAPPYDELARSLGVAKGSIGFIRMRCLQRLRQQLEAKGFV